MRWSGGAMVLGKLIVPGRLENSRARVYCTCSRCEWGWFRYVFSLLFFFLLSPFLWNGPI